MAQSRSQFANSTTQPDPGPKGAARSTAEKEVYKHLLVVIFCSVLSLQSMGLCAFVVNET
eukprot:2339060-Amphidinium_carterae.1